MRRAILAGLALAPLLIAPAFAETEAELNARVAASAQTTGAFVGQLGGALRTALEQGGPERAIAVCRDLAPAIAGDLSARTGWKVTRVGTRVRNPMLGTPDAWEQAVLVGFAQRLARGEHPDRLVHAEVVNEPQGRSFRFMKGLPTGEMCLGCHGAAPADNVKGALARLYPHDRATGYSAGQLRGAVSIRQPIN